MEKGNSPQSSDPIKTALQPKHGSQTTSWKMLCCLWITIMNVILHFPSSDLIDSQAPIRKPWTLNFMIAATTQWRRGAEWRGWASPCGRRLRWLWSGCWRSCWPFLRRWPSTCWSCHTEATSCGCVCCIRSRAAASWRWAYSPTGCLWERESHTHGRIRTSCKYILKSNVAYVDSCGNIILMHSTILRWENSQKYTNIILFCW